MEIFWDDNARHRNALILVEGKTDALFVEQILKLLKFPGTLTVEPVGTVQELRRRLHDIERRFGTTETAGPESLQVMALIDADELSIPDAVAHARKRLNNPRSPVFCAVPTIEAWLFADDKLASAESRTYDGRRIVERIVSPDALPEPKKLARKIFGLDKAARPYFVGSVDLSRAVTRSASLAAFVTGVVAALGGEADFVTKAIGNQISRTAFSNLLRELPNDTIAWRTMSGEYTAANLAEKVLLGDPIGFQYITDLLRLARDILAAPEDEEHDNGSDGTDRSAGVNV